MINKLAMMSVAATAVAVLGGCATAGSHVRLDGSNSPQECAHQVVMGDVPAAEQKDYVQRCSAGYRAAHPDDSSDTFKLHLSDKDKQQGD